MRTIMSNESASSNCGRRYSRVRMRSSSARASPPEALRVIYLSWNYAVLAQEGQAGLLCLTK